MSPATARRIALLTNQLAEALMTAALCAEEIRAAVLAELDGDGPGLADRPGFGLVPSGSNGRNRPLLDESTMCVVWEGKTVHLGHTVAFRLLARLARRPNQYVTHLDLLEDVFYSRLYKQYTVDLLRIAIYARSLVTNARLRAYLDEHYPDIVERFEAIIADAKG